MAWKDGLTPSPVGWASGASNTNYYSALITLSSAVLSLSPLLLPRSPSPQCCLYMGMSLVRWRRQPAIYASEQVCMGWYSYICLASLWKLGSRRMMVTSDCWPEVEIKFGCFVLMIGIIVDLAMGQIPRSTERISSCWWDIDLCVTQLQRWICLFDAAVHFDSNYFYRCAVFTLCLFIRTVVVAFGIR